jgi:ABC-2 type transport system ATP-binding protein
MTATIATSIKAVEFRGVTKQFAKFKLGPLNLNVPRGAIYGLIGPNGAGKTTALELIFGMGANDTGAINVLGLDHRRDEVELKRRVGYVSPDLNFQVWGNIGRTIRFVRGFYPGWDENYCRTLLKAFNLGESDKILTLSFGARTKLALLLALARRPEVLILDEPITGLDAISKQQVFEELLKTVEHGERTVLISSHGLTDIERFADHIGMLKEGKLLLEGRTDEIVGRFCMGDFFADESAGICERDGLTIVKRKENRWRVLLDRQSGAGDWLKTNGVRELSLTPVTLEEMFVALMKNGEAHETDH